MSDKRKSGLGDVMFLIGVLVLIAIAYSKVKGQQ